MRKYANLFLLSITSVLAGNVWAGSAAPNFSDFSLPSPSEILREAADRQSAEAVSVQTPPAETPGVFVASYNLTRTYSPNIPDTAQVGFSLLEAHGVLKRAGDLALAQCKAAGNSLCALRFPQSADPPCDTDYPSIGQPNYDRNRLIQNGAQCQQTAQAYPYPAGVDKSDEHVVEMGDSFEAKLDAPKSAPYAYGQPLTPLEKDGVIGDAEWFGLTSHPTGEYDCALLQVDVHHDFNLRDVLGDFGPWDIWSVDIHVVSHSYLASHQGPPWQYQCSDAASPFQSLSAGPSPRVKTLPQP